MATSEERRAVLVIKQRQMAASRQRWRNQPRRPSRRDGMRIRLSKIPGVTKGDAKKVLKQPYIFQCPPLEEFTRPKSRNFGSYQNYKGTEYLNRGGSNLQVITFRTLAVEWGRFTVERFYDVAKIVRRLERIHDAGWPVDLLATHAFGKRPELHINAVIESVTVIENAGEEDARYIDISFKQWREPTISVKAKGKSGKGANGRSRSGGEDYPKTAVIRPDGSGFVTDDAPAGRTGVGKPGEEDITLALIAREAYGKSTLWRHIANAQKPPIKNWGAHTPLIKMPRFKKQGGELVVPAPPDKDEK